MHSDTEQRFNINVLIALVAVGIVIAGVVLYALSIDALGWLIIGVFAVGAILIGLSSVGVNLFSRYTDAALKRDTLRFNHIETVMKMGYLPDGRNVQYRPIQIESPSDIPVSVAGETASTVAPYSQDALNLLALSLQWQRETMADPTQIIPYHMARKNDYFRDVAIWMRAVQFLLINQIGVERTRGGKKLGTFTASGTVEQAYQRMRSSTPLPLT